MSTRMTTVRTARLRSRVLLVVIAVALAALVLTRLPNGGSSAPRACAYSAQKISELKKFSGLAQRDISCALVFNDSAADWQSWQRPWFLSSGNPDENWARWTTESGKGRTLVISQSLFPKNAGGDWLAAGARGDFAPHARALARNLVQAGLSHAIIRLAAEANGTWQPYSLGTTPQQQAQWREFWRRTAIAMRSVPGAHFRFDWCVNTAVRPIPLSNFYPGDDVVDIVGVDVYDFSPGPGTAAWLSSYSAPDGPGEVAGFARAHGKQLSIPEWGLSARAPADDPGFVDGLAQFVRNNDVAYQSYFFAHDSAAQLLRGQASLRAYRRHFGPDGDSTGS
jgi:glycosyl hydrolase family 26